MSFFGSTLSILIIQASINTNGSSGTDVEVWLRGRTHLSGMFKALNLTHSPERTGYLNPDD